MYTQEKGSRLGSGFFITALLSLAVAVPVMSQGTGNQTSQTEESKNTHQGKSAAEIAQELANPNTTLGTMSFNLDYLNFKGDLPGADDQKALSLTFQPSLPVPLGEGLNFFARPAIPIVFYQDVPTKNAGYRNAGVNLGDIGFDTAVGKSFKTGLVLVGGMVGTVPTATDDDIAAKQMRLGPEGLVGVLKKWGVLGLLVTHQWDVATVGSREDYDTSITGGQYFYTFNLGQGWQIGSAPTYAYNHEAPSGQEWTFPVGIGIKKASILGGMPWKFGLEYWHYVVQPDSFGPGFQVRFTFGPVVPLPW